MARTPEFGKRGPRQAVRAQDARQERKLTADEVADFANKYVELGILVRLWVEIREHRGSTARKKDAQSLDILFEQIREVLNGLSKKGSALRMVKLSVTREELDKVVI